MLMIQAQVGKDRGDVKNNIRHTNEIVFSVAKVMAWERNLDAPYQVGQFFACSFNNVLNIVTMIDVSAQFHEDVK